MYYADTAEQSAEYMRMAVKHMVENGMPLDPMNYTVWYEYVSGRNASLKQAIDDLLSEQAKFTPTLNHRLYVRYIADESAALIESTRKEIKAILAKILESVTDREGEFSHFGKALDEYTEQIMNGTDNKDIHAIVARILDEKGLMEASGKRSRERLAEIHKEVEGLRSDIERLRREATTDALTGLANRRAFEVALSREKERSDRSGESLCLLLADLDQFKRVNDTFGHLVGDYVLRATASVLKKTIKGKDTAARYGGEEFALILPGTSLEGGMAVAEAIRASMEGKRWRRKDTGERIGNVTISLGISQYRPGETVDEMFQRADRALYLSKTEGRNRVTVERDKLHEEMRTASI